MNRPFRPAQTLAEVARQATLEPLPLDDPRYVDLGGARGSGALKRLRLHLEDYSSRDNRFAKIVFTGHRGSGKSTELFRIEHELAGRFKPLHLYLDESLVRDLDYTYLLLWLVHSLAERFAEDDTPLDKRLVDEIADWFATKVQEDIESLHAGISMESEFEGQAKVGFYVASLKVLARLKSVISGNVDRRHSIRRQLQDYSGELIARVNQLLDNAARVLEKQSRPRELLIVHDNLDRITADAARRLFLENGKILRDLRAHFLFTAPVPLVMSPSNIAQEFDTFTMPMVKTRQPNGKPFKPGLDGLSKLLGARSDLQRIFRSEAVVRFLAEMSGGSVRDLMRLLNQAQLAARADDKSKIDMASAREAATSFRIDFERMLVPGSVYLPLLAAIRRTKQLQIEAEASQERVQAARAFCSDLLAMGAVLEYNGNQAWYDVHPIVCEIPAFKDACEQA